MSLPKEPRQKMINFMYLVLTAMLALNVSSEILNAFKTVDHSLMTASEIVERKNLDVFKSFKRKLEDQKTHDKAAEWMPKAEKAKALADEMYNYIEGLKQELKKESGLKTENGKETFKEDDLDAPTRLLVSMPPNGKGKGNELYAKLQTFKKTLLAIDSSLGKEVGPNLPLDLSVPPTHNEGGKDDWAFTYFHMTPSIAALTIMSKFQNDIKNSEAQVVDYCHKKIGEVEIVYDEFKAFAGTNSQYLMPGEELVITAGMGAFSAKARPTITIDGVNVPLNADGAAEYKSVVNTPGANTKKVRITYYKPNGEPAVADKEVKYTVGVPSGMVVSTDRTRVFYKGIENPLSVTSGGGDEKVHVNVEGNDVSINKAGPGQYIVKANQLGTVHVIASDGKTTQKVAIPVKRIPDPIAIVGGSAGGTMNANVFRVQTGVIADLRDFVFEGVKFQVQSFMVICTGKGFDEPEFAQVSGPAFSGGASALIKRCQAGTTVTIGEIKLIEPGGGTRKIDQNITFILQ